MNSAATSDGGAIPIDHQDFRFAGLVQRIRSEFLEMPGLRLTRAQAQRLWGLDAATCDKALEYLVETGFLAVDGERYSRPTGEAATNSPRVRMAKAGLSAQQTVNGPRAARR